MDFDLMFTSFPKLLGATVVTLKLLSVSLFFGLFLGLFFAILRLNKNIFINKFAYGYSYVFRGTPLLVQIFIIYFGLGQIEYLRSTFLWVILKEPYWCAIIAFTLNTGAYTSEILRSAFQTIKPGIIEAGKSLAIPVDNDIEIINTDSITDLTEFDSFKRRLLTCFFGNNAYALLMTVLSLHSVSYSPSHDRSTSSYLPFCNSLACFAHWSRLTRPGKNSIALLTSSSILGVMLTTCSKV